VRRQRRDPRWTRRGELVSSAVFLGLLIGEVVDRHGHWAIRSAFWAVSLALCLAEARAAGRRLHRPDAYGIRPR
jgi:hypothetical protein